MILCTFQVPRLYIMHRISSRLVYESTLPYGLDMSLHLQTAYTVKSRVLTRLVLKHMHCAIYNDQPQKA